MRHTQREHTKVTKKVTEIKSCLKKANDANVRLRINVKESKKRVAELEAELRTRVDVERQMDLKLKVVNDDK